MKQIYNEFVYFKTFKRTEEMLQVVEVISL